VVRTESWDDFPNGRWGDSRSPAYGDLDGYGVSIRHTDEEISSMWGQPREEKDLAKLFEGYVQGEVRSLPWSDEPLSLESDAIKTELARVNAAGYLTINSQPAVNGAPSTDPVFGWGGKKGYVYQKAYVEFFCTPRKVEQLIERIEKSFPMITYHVVDAKVRLLFLFPLFFFFVFPVWIIIARPPNAHRGFFFFFFLQGNLRSNSPSDSPNAVTWGVFPGKEIIQPTIVDANSFLAWKDEAFELWNQWSKRYPGDADATDFLRSCVDGMCLVNIVDNDFVAGNVFEIFFD
jgi:methylenetetrahydrofolate reductase (NADPH)